MLVSRVQNPQPLRTHPVPRLDGPLVLRITTLPILHHINYNRQLGSNFGNVSKCNVSCTRGYTSRTSWRTSFQCCSCSAERNALQHFSHSIEPHEVHRLRRELA